MEEKWEVLSLTFRWPHNGLMLGFQFFKETEIEPYSTIHLHLLFITINYEWGFGDDPF